MTQWSTTRKHEPSSINGGRRYELRDRVSIEQLNNMTENSFYAASAASEAKEKAEEALSFAQGSGTTVFEKGKPVAEFNADKKANVDDIPTEYIKDANVENDVLTIQKANGLIITFQGGGGSSGGAVSSVNGKTGDVQLNATDVGALPSDTPLFSGNYNDLTNKPTIPTTASEVNALPDTTKYGASIDLSINNTTYVVTAQLKDQNGNNLGTSKTIDLPLESVVVSGSYDATNKKVILTLKDGSTIDFSVADLVSGLQKEITSTNKLSVNLIDGIDNYALKSVVDGVKTQASNAEAMARSNRSAISTLQSNQYTGSTYYYGTSSTDATTAIKIVECPEFQLVAGARISVYFANANDTTTTQINVNSTGAIYVGYEKKSGGLSGLPRNWWRAGQVVDFVYDGTYFLVSTGKADTTHYGAVKLTDDVSTYNDGWALSQRAGYDLSNRVKTLENAGGSSSLFPINAYLIQKTGTASPAGIYGGTWIKVAENVVLPFGTQARVKTTEFAHSFTTDQPGLKWRITNNAMPDADRPLMVSKQYDQTYISNAGAGSPIYPMYPANLVADLTENALVGVDIWLREDDSEVENM